MRNALPGLTLPCLLLACLLLSSADAPQAPATYVSPLPANDGGYGDTYTPEELAAIDQALWAINCTRQDLTFEKDYGKGYDCFPVVREMLHDPLAIAPYIDDLASHVLSADADPLLGGAILTSSWAANVSLSIPETIPGLIKAQRVSLNMFQIRDSIRAQDCWPIFFMD